jgi:tRNA 2-thiocytidine biosynthesis protein TtcA
VIQNKLQRKLVKAIFDYHLIDEGDHILIGLSGGKDSLAMTELLGERMKIRHPFFSLTAAHISVENIPYKADLEYLQDICNNYKIPFVHKAISFDASTDKRKSPCFLCSWNRRKSLFELAKELKCNKIALGHHRDDMIETLLINMMYQGTIGSMPPKLRMDKFDMTIIRPLALISEKELEEWRTIRNYRPQNKNCPYENNSQRYFIKQLLAQIEATNPYVRQNLWHSMHNVETNYLPQKQDFSSQ